MKLNRLFFSILILCSGYSSAQDQPQTTVFIGSDNNLPGLTLEQLDNAVPAANPPPALVIDPTLNRKRVFLQRLKISMERRPDSVRATYGLNDGELADIYVMLTEITKEDSRLAGENEKSMCDFWLSSDGSIDSANQALELHKQGEIDWISNNKLRNDFVTDLYASTKDSVVETVIVEMDKHSRDSNLRTVAWADSVRSVGTVLQTLDQNCEVR